MIEANDNQTEPPTERDAAAIATVIDEDAIAAILEKAVPTGLAIEVMELHVQNPNQPIFDLEVTAPAIPRSFYGVVKRSEIQLAGVPPKGALHPRIVFEVKAGQPKVRVRVALLTVGDIVPEADSHGATFIGAFPHPMSMMPITAWLLPPPTDPTEVANVEPGDFKL